MYSDACWQADPYYEYFTRGKSCQQLRRRRMWAFISQRIWNLPASAIGQQSEQQPCSTRPASTSTLGTNAPMLSCIYNMYGNTWIRGTSMVAMESKRSRWTGESPAEGSKTDVWSEGATYEEKFKKMKRQTLKERRVQRVLALAHKFIVCGTEG